MFQTFFCPSHIEISNSPPLPITHPNLNQLLHMYVRLDSRVAPLIHIIKSWARLPQIDLNDASRATFNSFSITLMILGYLQSIVPPVLPCIQAPQGKPPSLITPTMQNCNI